MKNRKYIYGILSLAVISILAGCDDKEIAIDNRTEVDDSSVIHIGGIEDAEVSISLGDINTRAGGSTGPATVDAETKEWLLGPLFGGLDITYGAKGQPKTEKVAILRLLKKVEGDDIRESNIKYSDFPDEDGYYTLAEYSFRYRNADGSEGDAAHWYDNGAHYFQGVFVPSELRYTDNVAYVNDATNGTAKGLLIDQSKEDETDNYTLLTRYLGMPADATINATVGRVKLPFRHRLARVITYVLIDPSMGSNVTVKGYKKDAEGNSVNKEDAATSEIKFCNVQVLSGVKETVGTNGHAELTPQWEQMRKVTPHFVEERASINSLGEVVDASDFIMFYNTELKKYIFPANDNDWVEAKNEWNKEYAKALNGGTSDEAKEKAAETADETSGYKRTVYGKVPCYDLIVRPTYSDIDNVMYDEQGFSDDATRQKLADNKNNIDFELTLNTGLEYYKDFQFDLDANFQTIVYLRIDRESVNYNSSGAEVWKEDTNHDGYYGVNNQNGNTLSYAGSSWQRAYRIGSTNPSVTDGHYYGQDDGTDADEVQDDDQMPWYPQYVDQSKWIEMFAEAHEGGLHHGDYFILDDNITIDATKLPDNFVFTGHLDGQDHIITLTGMGTTWEEWIVATTSDYGNTSTTLYTAKNKADVFEMPSRLFTKVHHDAVPYDESELTEVDGVKYVTTTLTLVPASDAVYYTNAEEYNTANGTTLSADDFAALSEEQKIKTPAVAEHYEINDGSIPGTTPKIEAYDEYPEANPIRTELLTSPDGTYFTRSGEEGSYIYSPFKPSEYTLYTEKDHTSGSTFFAGLNGAYDAQVGEANVHLEKGIKVPYVDDETKTGWRAEVINTKIKGADMFPSSAINADGKYNVTMVSGYIYNCWKAGETKTAIQSHTPALPKYK